MKLNLKNIIDLLSLLLFIILFLIIFFSFQWEIVIKNVGVYNIAMLLPTILFLVISILTIVFLGQEYNRKVIINYIKKKLENKKLTFSELENIKKKIGRYKIPDKELYGMDINIGRFNETIKFFESTSEEKAELIAKRLDAEYYEEDTFFRINMPMSFDLNIDTFLLYFPKKELKKEILKEHDKIVVIANEVYQKEIYKLATDRTNRLIVPSEQKLIEFLLSSESESVMIDIFAKCLLFKDLSPYQVNSGVNNESNFFGRIEIIRDIITKENANYIIVGARQLGKSSIIKALERRYEGSSKVDCYSFTMEDENIVLAMSRALGMKGEPTLDKVVSTIANAPKKSVFLIDEADRFVKHEKEVDYEVTEAFRKLSQEGKATFVLTGFWTLYFAVTSDYHSPLKNFGELIRLEGLDHDACRDLMIEPMKRIGVSYDSESIVENVIEFCGRRPNLIAITCNEVLKNLGSCIEEVTDENGRPCKRKVIKAESKRITQADIDEVIENSSLEDYLKGWGSMSEDEADNRLDRVIIYLTLEKESFRLSDIDAWFKVQGKKIDANRIKSSLERLVVGYILEERKKNYSYRVPLFREKLLEDDIEILLDGDLEQL